MHTERAHTSPNCMEGACVTAKQRTKKRLLDNFRLESDNITPIFILKLHLNWLHVENLWTPHILDQHFGTATYSFDLEVWHWTFSQTNNQENEKNKWKTHTHTHNSTHLCQFFIYFGFEVWWHVFSQVHSKMNIDCFGISMKLKKNNQNLRFFCRFLVPHCKTKRNIWLASGGLIIIVYPRMGRGGNAVVHVDGLVTPCGVLVAREVAGDNGVVGFAVVTLAVVTLAGEIVFVGRDFALVVTEVSPIVANFAVVIVFCVGIARNAEDFVLITFPKGAAAQLCNTKILIATKVIWNIFEVLCF